MRFYPSRTDRGRGRGKRHRGARSHAGRLRKVFSMDGKRRSGDRCSFFGPAQLCGGARRGNLSVARALCALSALSRGKILERHAESARRDKRRGRALLRGSIRSSFRFTEREISGRKNSISILNFSSGSCRIWKNTALRCVLKIFSTGIRAKCGRYLFRRSRG